MANIKKIKLGTTSYDIVDDSAVHLPVDSTPTSGSANLVTSGGVHQALTDGSVTNIGTATVGSATQPVYIKGGVPTAASALGTAATKNSTTSVTKNSSDLITSGAVWTAIDNLPEPMIFKGSLGTGGTITSLPTASSANIGFTYKVITAGTYASQSAKVGDVFISDGSSWVYIPSADEPSGTVTSVGVSNGGGITVSGSPVTSSGTITVSHADTSSQESVNNSGRTYIQDITLDTYGHVTGIASATETVTNTDTKVTQTNTTTNADYRILFSENANDTTQTVGARKSTGLKYNPSYGVITVGSSSLEGGLLPAVDNHGALGYSNQGFKSAGIHNIFCLENLYVASSNSIDLNSPTIDSNGNLNITKINGVTVGSSPKFTDTTYESKSAASGGTAVSLVTTGEKYTWNNKTSNTGTVTKVTGGTGLNGGDITTTGTLSVKYGTTTGTACEGNDSRLSDSRPASDVYSWAKASTKPSYSYSEISGTPTLGDAAAKGVTDSSSASALSTGTSLTTERDVYYGTPKINNSHAYTSSSNYYAPTGAGTSGYYLKSSGGTSAPTWQAPATSVSSSSTALVTSKAVYAALGGTWLYKHSISISPELYYQDGWFVRSVPSYPSGHPTGCEAPKFDKIEFLSPDDWEVESPSDLIGMRIIPLHGELGPRSNANYTFLGAEEDDNIFLAFLVHVNTSHNYYSDKPIGTWYVIGAKITSMVDTVTLI